MNTYTVPKYNAATGAGTLSGAAKEMGVTLQQLLDANPQYKSNPNLVKEGAQITIPSLTPSLTPASTPATPVTPTASNVGTPTATPTVDNAAAIAAQNKKIAQNAGTAGVSLDDLQKLLQTGSPVTQDQVDKIKSDLGITDLEGKLFTAPSKTTEQLYSDAYASSGLGDLKTKINDILTKISDKETQRNDALAKIDENPWLSEASRSGKAARTKAFYDNTINAYNNTLSGLKDLYNSGLTEVNNLVTRQNSDFTANYNLNKAKLDYLLKKAEDQVTNLKAKNATSVATVAADYLSSKAKSAKPETIGSAETGYFRWDATKGQFVQVTAGTGKKTTEAETKKSDIQDMTGQIKTVVGTDGYMSPTDYVKARKAWVEKGGYSAKEFDDIFAIYRNPDNPNYPLIKDQ